MLKAYKYCLLPTVSQKDQLNQVFGACRFVYNIALETKKTAWASNKTSLSAYDLMKQLTDLKNECEWLRDIYAQTLESSISHLDTAYKKFFKDGGFPKFKKRSARQSATYRTGIKINKSQLYVPKIGWIDFNQHRSLGNGAIRTATISKEPSGKHFVSILVQCESVIPDTKPIVGKTSVGIDVGLRTFATLSDGQSFENPKYLREKLNRLRVEQRKLARRYKRGVKICDQSKGYQKQKLVVAKMHEKIANKRKDFLHKTSTAIIKQYDTICLEHLNIKGMMKSNLAKSISDVSWYEFVRMLEYKAEWGGKNIQRVGRFFPSSKTCSACGKINIELKLSEREWTCSCGAIHYRDHNAAINIKNFGLKAQPAIAKTSQLAESIDCETLSPIPSDVFNPSTTR